MGIKIDLRPYQSEAFDLIYKKFSEGKKNILLVLPGGAGKTTIAAFMIKRALEKGKNVLFVAHRRELITQAVKRLGDYDIESGIIMAGFEEMYYLRSQVASVQTLARRDAEFVPDIIFIDEAHRSVSPEYLRILEPYLGKTYIVGMTGTPFGSSKKTPLSILYDDYVSSITSTDLVKNGWTVPAEIRLSGKITSKAFKVKKGEFDDKDVLKAFDVSDVYKNLINNFNLYASGKKAIVFCCNVEHSLKTAEAFIKAGINAEHLDGTTPTKVRDEIIGRFKRGETQVLTNFGILAEGFDVPDCECVVLNTSTKSAIKYFQACWRGCRPAPGKNHYVLIDMSDNWIRFDDPEQDLEVNLHSGVFVEKSDDKKEAPKKVCKHCDLVNPASAIYCKGCGEEFKKSTEEIAEEEFIKVTENEKRLARWNRMKSKDWHKLSDEELEGFAEFKGYAPFWVQKERERRKTGRKQIKIMGYKAADYFKIANGLENAYYNKKPIDASTWQFIEETSSHVVFLYKKPQSVEA